ncbi:histone acetyltransferase type B catalytic subunit [Aureobasidium pullulans]|uniref:Histone acetyltransferase type B catalytic subunit n=1 Tax=Aureobasidium pullulans TaxID=5580 RepID=A0A4S8S680_AURPU|nr:histone acetyltransferase type B catalytic subunit [Aureobasidium pullulans]
MSGSESPENSELVSAIQDQVEEWSTSSNDALHISLYRGDKVVSDFGPACTYPIFGEEEVVFGYRGLDMSLSLAAHNLRPHMDISWTEQFPQLGDIKASDIRGALDDFIPQSAFATKSRAEALADPNATNFTPPGTLLHTYTHEGRKYEIWKATLSEDGAREIMENAQILVPMFIEGGTIIALDEPWVADRWTLFTLYQVDKRLANTSPYTFVGFSTSYRVFTLPDRREPAENDLALLQHNESDMDAILRRWNSETANEDTHLLKSPLELPSRERISQFLIIPTHQGEGHGARLYETGFKSLISPDNVCELTVEDPNEAFDDMRDTCDLTWLRKNNDDFASLAIQTKIDSAKLKATENIPVDDIVSGDAKARIKKTSKIMPRQLGRLIEMQTYSKIPKLNRSASRISRKEKSTNEMDRAYYLWRLYVKQRLYISNRDVLAQLDREERAERLDATIENIQVDYDRLLELADKRAHFIDSEVGSHNGATKRKKKVVVESDEDEDDAEAGDVAPTSSRKKKRRTA